MHFKSPILSGFFLLFFFIQNRNPETATLARSHDQVPAQTIGCAHLQVSFRQFDRIDPRAPRTVSRPHQMWFLDIVEGL